MDSISPSVFKRKHPALKVIRQQQTIILLRFGLDRFQSLNPV